MLKQFATQKFESECKKAVIFVENDMPLGSFHDFLMYIKGHMVDLMVKAQKEELEIAESCKKDNSPE